MTHPERDQDLLLLAHGQLPPERRWATRWHLRHCGDCRRRLAQFDSTSLAIADAIRGPGMPRWSPPRGPYPTRTALLILLVTAALLVTVLGTLAVRSHGPAVRPALSGGCRPDLPNDLCR